MSVPVRDKFSKEQTNRKAVNIDDVKKDAKSFVEKVLGDVSKTSATKQIVLGASSGWITGFIAIKVGKTAAMALGGGIILLQIAHEKGYIKINWDKVNKNIDKVADKVEEKISGQSTSWSDKVERYVDRKLDKAEDTIRVKQNKAKCWFAGKFGDGSCQMKEVHIFLISFVAGIGIGIATG